MSRTRPVEATTLADAVGGIRDGAVVAVSGGGYRVVPEGLLAALAERYDQGGRPRSLTVIAVSMLERARGGRGGSGTGLNRLAKPGLMSRLISSSFSRSPGSELSELIRRDGLAVYNLPMGTVAQWLRSTAAGHTGLLTPVGIGTFVDPRDEGGRTTPSTGEPLSEVVRVAGEELLFYPRMPVDVALVKGTSADERGNVYLDREAYTHSLLYLAMAARNSGGRVIAEVNRRVPTGAIHPRMIGLPAPLVDAIVVNDAPWEDEQDPLLNGTVRADLEPPTSAWSVRAVIARRALRHVPAHATVNLGAGIPMYDVPEAARGTGRDDLYFTVEQGPLGGVPRVGGVSRNPEAILDQAEVFDFYEGGGPDVSCLSFGELDAEGNVNVSRFGPLMPGCGGFPNIAHGIKRLVFCGTLTTGGLRCAADDGRLVIAHEGRIDRFIPRVHQRTFNGPRALRRGARITVVTERAEFEVDGKGLELTAIAPGVDIDRDVLGHIGFPVRIRADLETFDPALFQPTHPTLEESDGLAGSGAPAAS